MVDNKLLTKLSQNLLEILNDEEYYDITIEVVLRYIYGGKLSLEEYDISDIIKILKSIQKCIPLIKFRNLTSKEFLKKVKPYKKILPKELYDDLLEYFLDNDYDPNKKSESFAIKEIKLKNIDSKIITNQHVEIISKWIDRLEISDKLTSSYEFKLLYRDSEDSGGMSERINKFHKVCDNHSRTVTIFKVKDRNEILGGYNPIEWKSDISCGSTKDSFIFSFTNNENYLLSRVKNELYAILNCPHYGPSFGSDLYLKHNKVLCYKNYYEKLFKDNNDGSFILDFFEVFQL
ncbi:carbohydrate-binding module family 13 protein [Rhizophagus irregularis DAOM 181602=DAOM 197198]|nr:carbohydrate-binding module family 13 protein [Rhizophagus irregularis DAOM 181602=DAOM 197198]